MFTVSILASPFIFPFQVEPFASLAALPRFSVPRVLINRELVGPFKHRRKRATDLAMTGDLVECVSDLAAMAGWEKELEVLVKGTMYAMVYHVLLLLMG